MEENGSNEKDYSSNLKSRYEEILRNGILVTEMAMELKERAEAGEKYVCYLRSVAVRASRAISTMNDSAKSFVLLGRRLTGAVLKHLENGSPTISDPRLENLGEEYERLAAILDKEILDIDDLESTDLSLANQLDSFNNCGIAERLRNLETRQRFAEQNCNLSHTPSARSIRSDVDEKYPDNWSKDSLIGLNNAVNLPPVPEHAFTSFSKPTRTSNVSSLKSMRKVKLFLQRAAVTSEDEESECDDHELSTSDDPTSSSEGGESRSIAISLQKVGDLCNIKEETPQDP